MIKIFPFVESLIMLGDDMKHAESYTGKRIHMKGYEGGGEN